MNKQDKLFSIDLMKYLGFKGVFRYSYARTYKWTLPFGERTEKLADARILTLKNKATNTWIN
jgi:hypothetical protein